MNTQKALITAAITGAFVLGSLSLSGTVAAEEKEKCYGVAKAGQNDCQTANSSCAGTSTMDNQGDAFVLVPNGLCDKLVGGSTESAS